MVKERSCRPADLSALQFRIQHTWELRLWRQGARLYRSDRGPGGRDQSAQLTVSDMGNLDVVRRSMDIDVHLCTHKKSR
jgi:hypothetical protein